MTGKEFQKKRRSLGYTQTEVADIMGFIRGTITNWEANDLKIPQYAEFIINRLLNKTLELKRVIEDE